MASVPLAVAHHFAIQCLPDGRHRSGIAASRRWGWALRCITQTLQVPSILSQPSMEGDVLLTPNCRQVP